MHVEAVVESKGEGTKENKITLLYEVNDGKSAGGNDKVRADSVIRGL